MKYQIAEFEEDEFSKFCSIVLDEGSIITNPRVNYDIDELDNMYTTAIGVYDLEFHNRYIQFYSIIDQKDEMVGGVKMEFISPQGELTNVEFLLGNHLNSSDLKVLMTCMLETFKQEFLFEKIFISVAGSNPKAISLLENSNFIKEGHLIGIIWKETGVEDQLIYGKRL